MTEKEDFKLKLKLENLCFYLNSLYSEIGKSVESYTLSIRELEHGSFTILSLSPNIEIMRRVENEVVCYGVKEQQPFLTNRISKDETFKSLLLDILKYIIDAKPGASRAVVRYSKEK